jgi:translocation and assembly module TamB
MTALMILLSAAGFYAVRTGILREQVRRRIVAEAQRATGGTVEVGNFSFNWRTLTAQVDSFVVHGNEPAGSAPLLKIRRMAVQLRIISLFEKEIDILSAHLDSPQVSLLIAADGSTNIPGPKVQPKPGVTAAEALFELRIGEVAVANASFDVHAAGQPPKTFAADIAGKKLESRFAYRAKTPDYSGGFSIQALNVRYGAYATEPLSAAVSVTFEKNRLRVDSAKVSTARSSVDFTGELNGFAAPAITAKYRGKVSIEELDRTLHLNARVTGAVDLDGSLRYSGVAGYSTDGKLRANATLPLANISATGRYEVDSKAIQLTEVTAKLLGAEVVGKAVLKGLEEYRVSGRVSHLDVARIPNVKLPYGGIVDGPFTLNGRVKGTFAASAKVDITPGASGVPLNGTIDASYESAHRQITLAPSFVALPESRLDVRGTVGQRMQVSVESRNLNDFLPALALTGETQFPVVLKAGTAHFDGSVSGALDAPTVEGRVAATNFLYSGETVDALTGTVAAQPDSIELRGASLVYQKVRTTFQVSVGLANWKLDQRAPIRATANLRDANLTGLLALAGRRDIPVSGLLTVNGQLSGTPANPQATATFSLAKGTAWNEPFDRIGGKVESATSTSELLTAQVNAGSRQATVTARYQHGAETFSTGQLSFQIVGNRMALGQLAMLRKLQPGLDGTAVLNAAGNLSIGPTGTAIASLNANLDATRLTLRAAPLGDLKLTAHTEAGALKVHASSNFAHGDLAADGSWALTGNYPGGAKLTFSKLDPATARELFFPSKGQEPLALGGTIEGKAEIAGDLLKPEAMTADLEIPQIEVHPTATGALARELADITIRNTQPVRLHFANSAVRVESARFTGPNTDLSLVGSVNLKSEEPLSLNLNGNMDLKLIRSFNPDIDSSGNLLVRVTVNGPFDRPRLGGLADLRNGSISLAGFPNGLSNANGRIVFDQNRANIQSLTAQTGGGTLQLDGFAAFGGPSVSFRVTGSAKGVRVRYPEGVSSISDANLIWTGSTVRSLLSGDVTVHKISYNPQSDFGAVLSLTAGSPAPTQVAQTGLIGGTQFDVRVQTAPDVSLQTGLATGLRTEANLRLRGSLANPSLLGRVNVNSGTINFLGNKYLINEGTISFFNPVKIDPIVNVDLQTQTRGVDVTLSVSGPLTKLNVTYRSDPPLQFSDIVGLLATGKTPSDPTIAARQTDTEQTWQQIGASGLVGQAIANPVSGRLQRFFGVSKLKIDPLLPGLGGAGSSTGGSNPGARLSLEQQVAPNVTFDYVISTNSTNSQVVRIEWAFSKHWSAVILREENSAFGIDFQYKKRFK